MKTFVLGAGCQKGGTTWLHGFLSGLRGVNLGFLKEYHVWDALHVPECSVFRTLARDWPQAGLTGIPWPKLATEEQADRLRSFHEDVANYFRYFAELLTEADLTGDLTPAYGMLPVAAYRQVRDGFTALGITVKVVFLMRDPVERICSHVRKSRNQALPPNDDLLRRFRLPDVQARTTYDTTLRNLEQIFPAERLHCEFYERLFTAQAINRLCDFLGIARQAADFATPVNESDHTIVFDESLKQEVAAFYASTYAAIVSRFGPAEVLPLWPRARDFPASATPGRSPQASASAAQAEHPP